MTAQCIRAGIAALLCWVSSAVLADDTTNTNQTGKDLFAANCAVCHGPTGAGVPALAPPLTHYPGQYATSPEGRRQLAMTVLYGMYGDIAVDQRHFNFKMPEFSQLDDAKLAAVLNFVVFHIAGAPSETEPLQAQDIARERSLSSTDGQTVREHRQTVVTELGLGQ